MPNLNEQLRDTGISIEYKKLELAKNQLSHIERARGLPLQAANTRETVWEHTLGILAMNDHALNRYPELAQILDYPNTVGMAATHDMWEGFTTIGDLDHSIPEHNGHNIRELKEVLEFSSAHHFVARNGENKITRKLLHGVVDEWFALSSIEALWIKALDLVQGTQSVVNRHLPCVNHVSAIAEHKIYPAIDRLVFSVPSKTASLSIFDWFSATLLTTYQQNGWSSIPFIQQISKDISRELKGFEL